MTKLIILLAGITIAVIPIIVICVIIILSIKTYKKDPKKFNDIACISSGYPPINNKKN